MQKIKPKTRPPRHTSLNEELLELSKRSGRKYVHKNDKRVIRKRAKKEILEELK